MSWGRFLLKRLGQYLVVLFSVSVIIFSISRFSGDPVALIAGFETTEATREAIRQQLGLDQPLYVQYGQFVWRAVHLDFGQSYSMAPGTPVMEMVIARLPRTIRLTLVATAFAVAIGLPIGVISAIRQGDYADMFGLSFAMLGQSVPAFWIGLLLIQLVAVNVAFFPLSGVGSWRHLLLPGLTLSFFLMASIARLTRSNMVDVLNENYIDTARSKGIRERTVYTSHALRNALIPVTSYVSVQIAYLLGGSVIVEQIFAYPGMGRLAVQAIRARDFPIVQGVALTAAVLVILINFGVDILYLKIDPRISYEEGE